MGKVIVIVGIIALVLAPLPYFMIWSQSPGGAAEAASRLDFDSILGAAPAEPLPIEEVAMRDGSTLHVRHLDVEDGPLLILLHGSAWHGGEFDTLARSLEGQAEIVVPDLRGHGLNDGPRGDVAHIGQLEEDIADLIDHYAEDGQEVILAGHSSGGGLAVRFAGGEYGGMIDSAILIAPYLGYDAPTTRPNSGGWAHPLVRRIIGISMLNTVGITSENDEVVLEFAMPQEVLDGPQGDLATTAYTYRMMTSFAPRGDATRDIEALPPFVLIAGAEDQAFLSDAFKPFMSEFTANGIYEVVPGAGHLDIVNRPETAERISWFLDGYK